MGSYAMRFGNRVVQFGNRNGTEEYDKAGKEAKKGLAMIMEAIEEDNMQNAKEGLEIAWEGVKQMCEISKEMKQQFGERRHDSRGMNSRDGDWNERDEEWMERRMRNSRGQYM